MNQPQYKPFKLERRYAQFTPGRGKRIAVTVKEANSLGSNTVSLTYADIRKLEAMVGKLAK